MLPRPLTIALACLVAAALLLAAAGRGSAGAPAPPAAAAAPPPDESAPPTPAPPSTPPAPPPAPPLAPPPAAATEDGEAAPEKDAEAAAAPPARVIVRENRNHEVMGHVELEDDEVIVVRTLEGRVESFAKRRVVAIVRLVDPAPGQHGVVVLRNGQVRDGIIIADTFDHVTVEIEGVRAKLKRDIVDHVELEPSFEERYAHLKATLKAGMGGEHLALCRWLVDQRRYDLAEVELKELLRAHDLEDARRLLVVVQAQLELERTAPPADEAEGGGDDAASPERETPQRSEPEEPENLISRADVNLIRVYEIDFRQPPKLNVPKSTVARLIESYGDQPLIPPSADSREKLYEAPPLEIVELMFKLRARDLYGDIEVLTEPRALNLFRQRVHNAWLINNCATSRCHGGPHAGRFFLHRRRYKDDRVRYTNLLILERLKLDPEWPLVNYERPLDSLIIQHGLPRDLARKPHPDVDGWAPVFRRLTDRQIRGAVEWMDAMMKPRIDYPVEFDPRPGPAGEEEEDGDTPPGRLGR